MVNFIVNPHRVARPAKVLKIQTPLVSRPLCESQPRDESPGELRGEILITK